MSSDRIEKQIVLRAPLSRVWRALTDSAEFGAWFRCKFDEPFVVGKSVIGKITHPGYENLTMEVIIEDLDPSRHRFAYRWHPYGVDPTYDYSKEPPTLVELQLSEVAGGTQLTVIESGFDKIPAARRDEAFRMNTNGWDAQLKNIERHVTT